MTPRKQLIGLFAAVFMLSGLVPSFAFAASAPNLGIAAPFAVFGKAAVTNNSDVGTTHIWGDVGADLLANITGLNDVTQVDGTMAGPVPGVQTAASAAYDALDAEIATGSLDLAGTHTVSPGVYTVGATTLNGVLTLSGAGVYIFRSSSSISTSGPAQVRLINGAAACNVFWQIPAAMTIGANSIVVGTIIAQTGLISLDTGATLRGRALSLTQQVTMDSNQITEPTCDASSNVSSGSSNQEAAGTITVVKVVINDNGGTSTIEDFPLFMNGTPVVSGETNTFFPAAVYDVTETSDLTKYTRTFSGDCRASGRLALNAGEAKVCIVTNNDIGAPVAVPPVPPLIDVVKVPSPLALPNGPGLVEYTYTLRNIGTVPVTNITMVGDTCFPIVRVSGDVNNDNKLDVNETWVHTCSTNLTETHTNVVTTTGWANGISAVDIANATVVVGASIVPPLIHITKTPSKFALLAGGGMITYTKKVTNPGTVPLSNVVLTDDQCSPVKFISGDTNQDSKLDMTETWTYTCAKTLTQTTTNTAYVSGTANGLTVRDFAIATVVVATAVVPTLPRTGFDPTNISFAWAAGAITLIAIATTLLILRKKKNA